MTRVKKIVNGVEHEYWEYSKEELANFKNKLVNLRKKFTKENKESK